MYIFVIDTDAYAGSFERELTAYVTGEVGECGVGRELADLFRFECPDQHWFEANTCHRPDDTGCLRPTYIYPSLTSSEEKTVYNSVAIFLDARPEPEIVEFMISRVRKLVEGLNDKSIQFPASSPFNVSGYRLLQETVVTNTLRTWEPDVQKA
jgi:hypothetical protein